MLSLCMFVIYVPMYSGCEMCEKEKNWKHNATYVSVNLNTTHIQKGYGVQIYLDKHAKIKCICAYLSTLHICTDTCPIYMCMCISIFVSSMSMYAYRHF